MSLVFDRGNNTDDFFKYLVLRNCISKILSVNVEGCFLLFCFI